MVRSVTLMTAAMTAVLSALFAGSRAQADDFYKGKTIKIVVSSAAGGSYDANARVLASHWQRQVPGNPNIIVQFMPGANGLVATNHVYNLAAKDGLTVGLFNRNIVAAPILGNPEARFKPENFNWLGTTASFAEDAYVVLVRSSLPQKTVEDMRKAKPPIIMGNAGTAIVHVLNDALALNLKVVEGYEKDTLDLAFERGEVDGESISYSAILSRKQHWTEKNLYRIAIQVGRTSRLESLPDVPTARELAQNQESLSLIELAEAPMLMAYPFALPPGVPEDRVKALQSSFMATVNDPAYVGEVKSKKMEYSPRSGSELQKIISDMAKAPKSAIDRYNALINRNG
jgi:tripartite-type tricarboxylate transporter receptor subunit TctC